MRFLALGIVILVANTSFGIPAKNDETTAVMDSDDSLDVNIINTTTEESTTQSPEDQDIDNVTKNTPNDPNKDNDKLKTDNPSEEKQTTPNDQVTQDDEQKESNGTTEKTPKDKQDNPQTVPKETTPEQDTTPKQIPEDEDSKKEDKDMEDKGKPKNSGLKENKQKPDESNVSTEKTTKNNSEEEPTTEKRVQPEQNPEEEKPNPADNTEVPEVVSKEKEPNRDIEEEPSPKENNEQDRNPSEDEQKKEPTSDENKQKAAVTTEEPNVALKEKQPTSDIEDDPTTRGNDQQEKNPMKDKQKKEPTQEENKQKPDDSSKAPKDGIEPTNNIEKGNPPDESEQKPVENSNPPENGITPKSYIEKEPTLEDSDKQEKNPNEDEQTPSDNSKEPENKTDLFGNKNSEKPNISESIPSVTLNNRFGPHSTKDDDSTPINPNYQNTPKPEKVNKANNNCKSGFCGDLQNENTKPLGCDNSSPENQNTPNKNENTYQGYNCKNGECNNNFDSDDQNPHISNPQIPRYSQKEEQNANCNKNQCGNIDADSGHLSTEVSEPKCGSNNCEKNSNSFPEQQTCQNGQCSNYPTGNSGNNKDQQNVKYPLNQIVPQEERSECKYGQCGNANNQNYNICQYENCENSNINRNNPENEPLTNIPNNFNNRPKQYNSKPNKQNTDNGCQYGACENGNTHVNEEKEPLNKNPLHSENGPTTGCEGAQCGSAVQVNDNPTHEQFPQTNTNYGYNQNENCMPGQCTNYNQNVRPSPPQNNPSNKPSQNNNQPALPFSNVQSSHSYAFVFTRQPINNCQRGNCDSPGDKNQHPSRENVEITFLKNPNTDLIQPHQQGALIQDQNVPGIPKTTTPFRDSPNPNTNKNNCQSGNCDTSNPNRPNYANIPNQNNCQTGNCDVSNPNRPNYANIPNQNNCQSGNCDMSNPTGPNNANIPKQNNCQSGNCDMINPTPPHNVNIPNKGQENVNTPVDQNISGQNDDSANKFPMTKNPQTGKSDKQPDKEKRLQSLIGASDKLLDNIDNILNEYYDDYTTPLKGENVEELEQNQLKKNQGMTQGMNYVGRSFYSVTISLERVIPRIEGLNPYKSSVNSDICNVLSQMRENFSRITQRFNQCVNDIHVPFGIFGAFRARMNDRNMQMINDYKAKSNWLILNGRALLPCIQTSRHNDEYTTYSRGIVQNIAASLENFL